MSPGGLQLALAKNQIPCRIASRTLGGWVQGLEERDERRSLSRTQVVAIGRHVASALNDLPDELVLRQAHGNAVEGRSSLSPQVAKRVAVAALLDLKNERTLPLKGSGAMNVPVGDWISAPGAHVRTPRRELCHASKRAERDRCHQDSNDCNWPALPAFFSFPGKKWQKN
jgi:hypothetical protein